MGHFVIQILLIAIVLVANGISNAETEIPRPTTKLTTTEIPTTHRTEPTRTTETPTETPTTETTPTTQTPIPTTTARPTTQPTTTERTTTSRPTTQTTETPTTEQPTTTPLPTTTPIPTTQTPNITIPTTTSGPTDTPTTVTPDIITNPESTTSAQVTTEFPIWTTSSTPNVTTSSSSTPTPTPTTTTTSITTSSPTESPTTTTGNSTGTTPNSTTTTLPTPTLPPTPDAPSFPWNVSYPGAHGNYCIMAVFAARVDIVYENVDKQIVQTGFDLPKNASINKALSMCDPYALEEVFALDFQSESISQGYFAAIFDRNNATNHSTLFELMISVPITEDMFPGIDPSVLNNNHYILLSAKNLSLFDTEYYHSFTCKSTIKTNLSSIEVTNGHLNGGALNWIDNYNSKGKVIFHNATLETSDMQLQTFMLSNRTIDFFMLSEKCKGDQPDTLWTVDFIVAGVMAALAAFVLIAYFVGKRIQLKKMQEDSLEAALVNNE